MTVQTTNEEFVAAVKAEVKSTYDSLDKKTTDLGAVIDEIKKAVGEKASTTDLEGRLKDIQAEVKKGTERADEIERKANRAGLLGRSDAETKSAGLVVTESDEYKSFVKARGGRMNVEMKAITSLASGTPRNPLLTVQSVPGIIRAPERPVMVRDLLPVGRTTSGTIEFPRENVFTNSAAIVAEGALKPESNITFTAAKADVATIAHWLQASKQILDDAAFLQSYIDGRMRDGLVQVEENELLLGDGTTGHMLGLVQQATAAILATIPNGPAVATMVDKIRWAKLQVRKAFFPATGVVLNPEDWAKIELLKDAQSAYLFSAFTSGAEPRLWGMRVVESDAIPAGSFLVGAFALAAQIWDREQANVEVSTEDRDNFVKNMVTIRAEERLALTVYRPKAFVYGTFSQTT